MEPGGWLAAASATLVLVAALALRTRMRAALLGPLLVLGGAGLGWGGMMLQPDPSTGEHAAAVVLLAVLVPAHVRIVLGPFGPRSEA